MMPLNLLKLFDRRRADHAVIATFDLDPVFFERRLLRTQGFGGARRILVLMDAGRYRTLLNEGLTAAEFGRRYLVVPVSRQEGVVHPKVYLLLGRRTLWGVVGSSNCTQPGIAYNMELGSAFEYDPDRDSIEDASAHHLARAVYRFVRRLGEHAGPHDAGLAVVAKEVVQSGGRGSGVDAGMGSVVIVQPYDRTLIRRIVPGSAGTRLWWRTVGMPGLSGRSRFTRSSTGMPGSSRDAGSAIERAERSMKFRSGCWTPRPARRCAPRPPHRLRHPRSRR